MIIQLDEMVNMKFYVNAKVKLPGKEENMRVLYLLGDSLQDSLNMSNTPYLYDSTKMFKLVYRPIRYNIKLFNISIRKTEVSKRKEVNHTIKSYEDRDYRPFPKVVFDKASYNVMYDLSGWNELFASRVKNKPIRKCISEYFNLLSSVIPTNDPIVLVNAQSPINIGSIEAIKSNPIMLFYYALLKFPTSLSSLGSIRVLVQSHKGSFIFKPSEFTKNDKSLFKMLLKKTLVGNTLKTIDNEKINMMVDIDEVESDAVTSQDTNESFKHSDSNEFDLIGDGLSKSSKSIDMTKNTDDTITYIDKNAIDKSKSDVIVYTLPNIRSVQELVMYMSTIPYGIWDPLNKTLVDIGNRVESKKALQNYKVQSPLEFASKHGGWCLDNVVFEYEILTKLNVNPMTFVVGGDKYDNIHVFNIYQQGKEYIYIETSFSKRSGLHRFNTLEEAVKNAGRGWNNAHGGYKRITIRKYQPMSYVGYSINQFLSAIRKLKPFLEIDNTKPLDIPNFTKNVKLFTSANLTDDDYESPEEDRDTTNEEDSEDDGKLDIPADILSESDEDDSPDTIVESISDKTSENKTGGKPKSRANTARDAILRTEQKLKVINGKTIQDIVTLKGSSVKIPSIDTSNQIKSPNQGVSTLTSVNIDKVYETELKDKDIVSIFDNLENTKSEFHILDISKKDTSNSQTLKETWTVKLETNDRKRHTVSVDIPTLFDDMYYLIDGVKYILQKQVIFLPIVKVDKNNVRITSNYNRMLVSRTNNKLDEVAQCLSLIRKLPEIRKLLQLGHIVNPKTSLTTLEYDQYANELFSFTYKNLTYMFNQPIIKTFAKDNNIELDPSKVPIGWNTIDGELTIMYVDPMSGKDSNDKTITDNIMDIVYELTGKKRSRKYSNRSIYSTVKLNRQELPIINVLLIWEGLTKTLARLPKRYKHMIVDANTSVPNGMLYIQWKDFRLVYDSSIESQLLFNGLHQLNTKDISLEEADDISSYMEYVGSVFSARRAVYMLSTAYELWIDPITKEILTDLDLPTHISDILIYVNGMLSDNTYTDENDMSIYRIRSGEAISGMLHYALASNYSVYQQSNKSHPFNIPRKCVLTMLMDQTTFVPYSTINPCMDTISRNTISPRGYQGTNKDKAYNEKKRSYDKSMIGIMSLTTSTDGHAGIRREITANTNIINARGYSQLGISVDKLSNTNTFAMSELLTVNTTRFDDPYRTSMTVKQTGHMVYTAKSDPCPISNGTDEAIAFAVSSAFAVKSEDYGEVIEINDSSGFAIIKYKNGKNKAIDLKHTVDHNSGGGFYVDNSLVLNNLKVGDKIKPNQILAYNPKYFASSKLNGVRFKIGRLAKVAIMSSYNTYEDAGVYTQSLANDLTTNVIFKQSVVLKPWTNVASIVNEGDHIKVGDVLISYQESKDTDQDVADILAVLGEKLGELVTTMAVDKKTAKTPGKIAKIEIYCTVDLDELSQSMRSIVEGYYEKVRHRKETLNKYDPSGNIVKCGILFPDSDEKSELNQYQKIDSQIVGDGVLINFYIQHDIGLSIGDKVCLFSANKTIVSEIIQPGYEPYSEFRPDEEVSGLIGESAVLNRMVPSVLLTCAENKIMIELKRKITDIWKS